MVHNGIEYGVMAAYAEGMAILEQGQSRNRQPAARMPRPHRYGTWQVSVRTRRGRQLPKSGDGEAWLPRGCSTSLPSALNPDPDLGEFSGHVSDSGEGRWTVQSAIDLGVPAQVIAAALTSGSPPATKVILPTATLSAMRKEFGGHVEVPAGG